MSDRPVTWFVQCDARGTACPSLVSVTGYADAATQVRARIEARDQGWRCDASGDWCPLHKEGT